MNGQELSELIDQRLKLLVELMELSDKQIDAIDASAMSDLMRVLSEKQRRITKLSEIAQQLSGALDDDPKTRVWESPAQRETCRDRQIHCDRLHTELLAIEAECEKTLEENRLQIHDKLQKFDSGRLAASSYAQNEAHSSQGTSLDLSSD